MRRWPLAPVLLQLLLLLLGGIYSLSNLSDATRWVRHTDDVRVALGKLLTTCTDAETGVRGYVVAGEPSFLEPYDRAVSTWDDQLDRVRILTSDNSEQQQRLSRLRQVVGQRLDKLTMTRAAYEAGQRGAELTAAMLSGKRTMDE